MANFRIYPGLFVRVTKDIHGLKSGNVYQVLSARYDISLVGVNGNFPIKLSGQWLEPVYPEEVSK